MSNGRKLRAKKKPASKRGTVTPEEHKAIASVRGSLSQLTRRGLVDKGGLVLGERGARTREWRVSERGGRHAYRTVTVDAERALTAAGLLRVPLPAAWVRPGASSSFWEGALVRIADPGTGETGVATVVRINERKRLMYLDPEWGAEPSKPRSQAGARAEARDSPEPCPSCGAETGSDCLTRNGTRAAWPHAGRDPMLTAPEDTDDH